MRLPDQRQADLGEHALGKQLVLLLGAQRVDRLQRQHGRVLFIAAKARHSMHPIDAIAAQRHRQSQRVSRPLRHVIFGQLSAQLARRYAHQGVGLRIKIRLALENLQGDHVTVQIAFAPRQGFLHGISQEIAHATRPKKGLAVENALQFIQNLLFGKCLTAHLVDLRVNDPTSSTLTGSPRRPRTGRLCEL